MTESSEGKRAEVNAALHALYLNAPAEVARDVALKVNAALDESASEVERLREALTQLIYAIDLPSELGKIGSYTYHTAALQRLHGALSLARAALADERQS